MNRKGAELTLNMMIIIIILLIALVVLIIIFSGKTSIFANATGSCESKGGQCLPLNCSADTQASLPSGRCDLGKVCCIQVLK